MIDSKNKLLAFTGFILGFNICLAQAMVPLRTNAQEIDGIPIRLLQRGSNYTVYASETTGETESGFFYKLYIYENSVRSSPYDITVFAGCGSPYVTFKNNYRNSVKSVTINIGKPNEMRNSTRSIQILYNFLDAFKNDWLYRGQYYC